MSSAFHFGTHNFRQRQKSQASLCSDFTETLENASCFFQHIYEYYYQCMITFWGLRDSRPYECIKPIYFKIDDIDPRTQ